MPYRRALTSQLPHDRQKIDATIPFAKTLDHLQKNQISKKVLSSYCASVCQVANLLLANSYPARTAKRNSGRLLQQPIADWYPMNRPRMSGQGLQPSTDQIAK